MGQPHHCKTFAQVEQFARDQIDGGFTVQSDAFTALALVSSMARLLRTGAPIIGAGNDISHDVSTEVLQERRRQIEAEGRTTDHDDQYNRGQLALAAASYATFASQAEVVRAAFPPGDPPSSWPWSPEWWKPHADERRNLVKAGALIIAEIERLDRAAAK